MCIGSVRGANNRLGASGLCLGVNGREHNGQAKKSVPALDIEGTVITLGAAKNIAQSQAVEIILRLLPMLAE